jgi:RNA polymerase sigma-70 factor (ECF subfamily)
MTGRDPDTTEDIELLRASARGDHESFRRLVERHRVRVQRICLGFVKNPEEAEDLTQDVFFQIYRSSGGFRGDSAVSTWIYRIAVNHSLNRLRKRRRQAWFQFFSESDASAHRLEDVPSRSDSPEVLAQKQERIAMLQKALGRLPESQRVAFTLHKVRGMSYEEVARIMDASLSAVESRIHRAKLNLQKYLVDLFEKDS